jgi:hypothetical protein
MNIVGTFLRHLGYGVTTSTYFFRSNRVLHLFPTGCKIHFDDFFKFAPAGKKLRKVEFTYSGEFLYMRQ